MTDKELLELAAKTAGIEIEWYAPNVEVWDFAQVPNWNPLTNDGDALRLAVQLKMDVCVDDNVESGTHVIWMTDNCIDDVYEYHGSDSYAATRRAIVRAAAEIGKAL
jgi:hypothetical protein